MDHIAEPEQLSGIPSYVERMAAARLLVAKQPNLILNWLNWPVLA
jgi:hypothetical protein